MATRTASSRTLPLLQDRLILNRYFCSLFGFEDFKGLRDILRHTQEGWESEGYSYFFRVLEGLDGLKIPTDKLAEYDLSIKGYEERLNRFRTPPVRLKYFQYLAVLFSEIFLERYFNDREEFLRELNDFVREENERSETSQFPYLPFTDVTYPNWPSGWPQEAEKH